MIPGANILSMALTAIGKSSFSYLAFVSRTPNSIGQDIASYAPAATLQGSVQPVPRSLYQQYGLDFQRNYINVYVSKAVIDVTRDVSGDMIAFNGNSYQCLSVTPWVAIDGWNSVLCVQAPAPTPPVSSRRPSRPARRVRNRTAARLSPAFSTAVDARSPAW